MWKPQAALGRDGVRVYEARRAGHILSGLLDSQAFSAFPDRWHCVRPHPYLVIFAIVTWRRSRGHPFFPIGSPGLVFGQAPILWILAAGIATYTAYRHGTFGPHSMGWRVNTFISDPLEAPFAEEFRVSRSYTYGAQRDFPGLQIIPRISAGNARVGRRFFGVSSGRTTRRHAVGESATIRRECASAGHHLRASLPANAELMVRHIHPRIREL